MSKRGDQPAHPCRPAAETCDGLTILDVLAKDAPPMPAEWWDAWFEANVTKTLSELDPEETMAAVERAVAEWGKHYALALLKALGTP